jgi:hypothetical protein
MIWKDDPQNITYLKPDSVRITCWLILTLTLITYINITRNRSTKVAVLILKEVSGVTSTKLDTNHNGGCASPESINGHKRRGRNWGLAQVLDLHLYSSEVVEPCGAGWEWCIHAPNNAGNCHEFPSTTHVQYGLYAHITASVIPLVLIIYNPMLHGAFTEDIWLWILVIPYKEILAILSHIFRLCSLVITKFLQ